MNKQEIQSIPTIDVFNRHSIAESAAKILSNSISKYPALATDKMIAELADIEQQAKILWDELSERMDLVPSAILSEAIDGKIIIEFK